MDDEVSPLETGLNFGVKMKKDEFIGKKAIEDRGTPKIERIGLKVTGRGIIREHQDLYAGGSEDRTYNIRNALPFILDIRSPWHLLMPEA